MLLTADNVNLVIQDCLFQKGEDITNNVKAEGIANTMHFHPERLASRKADIESMIEQLPAKFRPAPFGGSSFLNMCENADGEQWTGLHSICEALMLLGVAVGKLKYVYPRANWFSLPGKMPFLVIAY